MSSSAMPAPAANLAQLSVGSSALVKAYPAAGVAFTRLREMGLLPGTRVTLIRVAPLGDPLEIQVRGYRLSLRKSEAEHILLESAPPAA
jgi:ferrous iron transport protein A